MNIKFLVNRTIYDKDGHDSIVTECVDMHLNGSDRPQLGDSIDDEIIREAIGYVGITDSKLPYKYATEIDPYLQYVTGRSWRIDDDGATYLIISLSEDNPSEKSL